MSDPFANLRLNLFGNQGVSPAGLTTQDDDDLSTSFAGLTPVDQPQALQPNAQDMATPLFNSLQFCFNNLSPANMSVAGTEDIEDDSSFSLNDSWAMTPLEEIPASQLAEWPSLAVYPRSGHWIEGGNSVISFVQEKLDQVPEGEKLALFIDVDDTLISSKSGEIKPGATRALQRLLSEEKISHVQLLTARGLRHAENTLNELIQAAKQSGEGEFPLPNPNKTIYEHPKVAQGIASGNAYNKGGDILDLMGHIQEEKPEVKHALLVDDTRTQLDSCLRAQKKTEQMTISAIAFRG